MHSKRRNKTYNIHENIFHIIVLVMRVMTTMIMMTMVGSLCRYTIIIASIIVGNLRSPVILGQQFCITSTIRRFSRRFIPECILSKSALDDLRNDGHGVAPDLFYAKGDPNISSPSPGTDFDKQLCSLILIEVGFCADLSCHIK